MRRVPNRVRSATAQVANAVLATTKTRIQVRVGSQADGSRMARPSITNPASWRIE